jgi:hypothetical protein
MMLHLVAAIVIRCVSGQTAETYCLIVPVLCIDPAALYLLVLLPLHLLLRLFRRWACIAASSASAVTAKTSIMEMASQHPAVQQPKAQRAATYAPTAAAASSGCSTPQTWQHSAATGS